MQGVGSCQGDTLRPHASGDETEGTVLPTPLTFTTDNWHMPQTVTITGADDDLPDNDTAFTILSTVSSADPEYDGFDTDSVTVVNQDNEEYVDLGPVDFGYLDSLSPFGRALWFRLEAAHNGWLTVQSAEAATQGQLALALYDSADLQTPLAASNASDATPRFDYLVEEGQVRLLKVTGTSSSAALTIANVVNTSGTAIEVFGTDGVDHFEFEPTGSYRIAINGVDYHFDNSQYETIVFTGGAGNDTATLSGGPDTEIGRFFPDHGTFGENSFLVTVNEVTAITAYGGGGLDEVYMYDSPGNDEFVSRKYYGKLSGEEFAIETFDFMYNYGYATTQDGGTDIAYMEDTATADKFKFDWPNPGQFFGKMYGGGTYYNRAKYFEQIYATMTGGKDTVRLFGSDGDETFYGQRDESRLTGAGFDVTVTGYNTLTAYAMKGNDIAYVEDSDENDTTRARPHKIMLWGGSYDDPTYMITARKFDEYYLEAKNGGYDQAKLHDTVFDDYLEASGNSARLYNDNGSLDLLYEAIDFEWVKAYGTEDNEQITNRNRSNVVEPLDFILVWYGQWE